ncbi:hypothetical protein ACSV9I_14095 [Rhizobium sp. G187]|uniref:hypothetical protein n=1 Tax=Rhizobium sp. G187 TaxID=3451352 RepID=UPI003EE47D9A
MNPDGDEYDVWRNHNMQQARQLLSSLGDRGLRFEAFLPSELANWFLTTISVGRFAHPNEMIVEMATVFRQLELHPDLMQELLARQINQVRAGKTQGVSNELLSKQMDELWTRQAPGPLEWKK